jgi:methionyl-tRNA formyltransferase
VIEAGPGRLVVSTGEGFLEVYRLQLAGRNAMPAAEFLNANPLVGEKLG